MPRETIGETTNEIIEANDQEKNSAEETDVQRSVRQTLLNTLPVELQEKWRDATIPKLLEIIKAREEYGYRNIKGYHTSDSELEVGDFIMPGSDGEIHYATSLDKLYPKKAKYLYIIDGSNNDPINDEEYGWRTSYAKRKIITKIPLDEETMERIGAQFAELEYS